MTLITAEVKIIFGGDFLKFKTVSVNRYFIIKVIIILLFAAYTLIVVDFTLVNGNFGRNVSNIFTASNYEISEYFSQRINLVPFATVRLFVNAYKQGILKPSAVLENIFGNFFIFMPFAFFLPNIFKKINSALKFAAVISLCVITVEILQIVLLTGSADIDDFILNTGGAMAAYGVLCIGKIKNFLNKLIYGE